MAATKINLTKNACALVEYNIELYYIDPSIHVRHAST